MANFSLTGNALITGSASGIGREIGLTFAEAGVAGIVFADINIEGATAAAEESKKLATNPNFKATAFRLDVTDIASVQNVVMLTVHELGSIDYLINSAGV
jgi:NAD(P)-dependent dehydrogenase (short-subunit alcohol dehydrogenase family)